MECSKLEELLATCKNRNSIIYIWGVGAYGIQLGKFFEEKKICWNGYYDNYMSKDAQQVNGKPVYPADKIEVEATYILSMKNYSKVYTQLVECGVNENNIIFCTTNMIFGELDDISSKDIISTEEIMKLKNTCEGKQCFIIGNGPSLKIEDLDKLDEMQIDTFGCNRIYEVYEKTNWRPKYYFFTDIIGIKENLNNEEKLRFLSDNSEIIFSRTNGDLYKYQKVIDNMVLFKSIYSDDEKCFDFSNECEKKVYIGYTVTYAMLQIAIYMGYKEIFLLGIDHNYAVEILEDGNTVYNDVKDHSQLVGGYQSQYYHIDKTTKAYIAAEQYAKHHGVKIYNATRGGKLEVFERVDFDSLF